jgi:hypothetical protein
MKKSLNVYYAKVPNMGDKLNVAIIERLFGYKVHRHTFLTGELSAIGSGLGQFTLKDNPFVALAERISGFLFPTVTIWGTGFVCNKDNDTPFYRRNMRFAAVRGELSKKRVERILGRKLDIPMGDAGILASYLLTEPVEKNYQVGIIAHYKEQDEPIFQELVNTYPQSLFIDVRQTPDAVIRQIASCECIISSSLHGLIIADSLGIPNIHIKVSDKLLGDGFKFDDYYSAYDLKHPVIDIKKENIPSLEWVKEHYPITKEMVETVKRNMIQSFPFEHAFQA